jgi:transcriptional regulator with XRE-family HTH domain
MTTTESFGQRLRRLRTARGLRVLEVAYAAGITEGAIRQMEGGQTKGASLVVGLRLAKLLSVSPDYLASGTERTDDDTGLTRTILSRLNDHERRIIQAETLLAQYSVAEHKRPPG